MRLRYRSFCFVLLCALSVQFTTSASPADPSPTELYKQLKDFKLGTASVKVQEFALDRDDLHMVFTGDFYFAEPTGNGTYGAVFLGQGRLRLEPRLWVERESVKTALSL